MIENIGSGVSEEERYNIVQYYAKQIYDYLKDQGINEEDILSYLKSGRTESCIG